MIFAPQNSVVRNVCGQIPPWIRGYPITPPMWSLELQKLEGHTSGVSAVAFSQDGSLLASASHEDRQIPECPICRDAMCCGVTQCGHQFCVSCFDRWYREQGAKGAARSCPTCRASLLGLNGPIFIKMHGI